MSVPVRRQTHGKTRRRRSHHALKAVAIEKCTNCAKPVQPHHACPACGYYAKKQVLSTARAAKRAIKQAQARTALQELAEEEAKADQQVQTGQKAEKKDQPKA